jgi:secreted PhoX family phosphatase
LEALQVLNDSNQPITFASQSPHQSPDQIALHTYGKVFKTNWVTVHDTAVDGTTSFNANLAAKAANATPFKRPENGLFRPGSHFREYYFDETGDTNAASTENDCCGGWGSAFKITQSDPSADSGHLTIFYKADAAHAAFDNIAFLSDDQVTFVQDQGEGLHGVEGFDSGFVFDVNKDYSDSANQPVRWLAQGRDPSATLDAANGGFGKNDQDNEITGTTVSNGDPRPGGILGAKIPHLFKDGWRFFYTQQHGDNPTYEVIPSSRTHGEPDD